MSARFHCLSYDEFVELLQKAPIRRSIDGVHLHHTWRPRRADFQGAATLERLWQFHTQVLRWCDLPQHLTIDPQGGIWTGRHWNLPPASASGYNGNLHAGPLMIQLVGDFNNGIGADRFDGVQRETALKVIAEIQSHFRLPPQSLRFHKHLSTKSCPGDSLNYEEILREIDRLRQQIENGSAEREQHADDRRPLGANATDVRRRVDEVLRAIQEHTVSFSDPHDSEPDDETLGKLEAYLTGGYSSSRGTLPATQPPETNRNLFSSGLTPEQKESLRAHVVNLNNGTFARTGQFETRQFDVEAMFGEHLERALNERKLLGEKLKLLFFAHGGLVNEAAGLAIAQGLTSWWKENHIYPIYFVWETGFWGTVGQLLRDWRQGTRTAAARGLTDLITDPLIERSARGIGNKVWSGMKRSAEQASAPGGGARFVAQQLAKFCEKHPDEVELYALGHSAGSIFHAHFLPAAIEAGAPPFESLYLLAPAVRVDEFQQRLQGMLDRDQHGNAKGIKRLTMFTMNRDREEADECFKIYRKSLLYLVSNAFESEPQTPILGLEESVRSSREMTKFFGLAGNPAGDADVVWSVSRSGSRSASASTTHGGFDNDAATMESVARRILNRDDIKPFPSSLTERSVRLLEANPEEGDEFTALRAALAGPSGLRDGSSGGGSWAGSSFNGGSHAGGGSGGGSSGGVALAGATVDTTANGSGRRRALCIGIDEYPTAPLHGCVNDAQRWADALRQLGFDVQTLLNRQATRDGILRELTDMVVNSKAGDVVVLQFAGHGTTLPDLDGDEAGGDTPGTDEAFVPFDYGDGAYVIDDDMAQVFGMIPRGVNVSCFIDCCHSGTITRLLVGVRPHAHGVDERPRFLVATEEMKQQHATYRQSHATRSVVLPRDPESMSEVVFSACRSDEVAWESSGQGDFTTRALRLLPRAAGAVSHEEFQRQVVAEFGASPRQHPQLDCATPVSQRVLLQPLSGSSRSPGTNVSSRSFTGSGEANAFAEGLRAMADVLQRRS